MINSHFLDDVHRCIQCIFAKYINFFNLIGSQDNTRTFLTQQPYVISSNFPWNFKLLWLPLFFSAFNFHFSFLHSSSIIFLNFIFSCTILEYCVLIWPLPLELFRVNETNYWNKLYIPVNRLRIPVGLCTSTARELNQVLPGTNPACGQSGTWTRISGFKSRTWTTLVFSLLLFFFKRKKLTLESNKRSCLPDELYHLVILRLLT